MGRRKSRAVNRGYFRLPHGAKECCAVCGEQLDQFHDQEACVEAWIQQCDQEQANPPKEGKEP